MFWMRNKKIIFGTHSNLKVLSFLLFMFRVCHVSCLFIVALWKPAGKVLTSWLSCMWCFIVFCHFPMWLPGSGVVL